jgi:hypothetical protein
MRRLDEETTMKRSSWLVLIVCTLLAGSAAAQNKCTFHTTNARYSTTCQGFASTAPGAPLTPFSLLGTCTGDANGFFNCSGTQSFDGTVVPAADAGQSIVNPDCTGQIIYNKGTSLELDINFLILHDGGELRGMLQNTGTAVQCDLIRMDAHGDHAHE